MNRQVVFEWSAEIERQRVKLLDRIGLAAIIGGLVALALLYIGLPAAMSPLEQVIEMLPFIAGWLVIVVAWVWRGVHHRTRGLILLLLTYVLGVIIFVRGGLPGSGRVWLLLLPSLAFVLLGPRSGVAAGVVAILTYAFFALAISQKWIVPQVAEDLTTLSALFSEGGGFLLAAVVLTLILWSFNQSWMEALRSASTANENLQRKTQELERTNERLHRQTTLLQVTAEIAHVGSSILEPEDLLVEVVNRIQEGLQAIGVYYVGLYLLDEDQQCAVLRAATGEAGRLLLEVGHKLELDETSTVGWCINHRRARVASDTGEEVVLFDILPLALTRSEVALPLRSRGRIIGALSVQSTQKAAFDEADTVVLQMMADQVSVALDNAWLFSRTEAALEDAQSVQRRYLAQAWREFLATSPMAQIDYVQPGTEVGDEDFLREVQRAAMVRGQAVARDGSSDGATSPSEAALVVPLKLRGQVIGTMALHETRHRRTWSVEDIAMAEAVAEQVAQAVENLRLMSEAQRRAAHERLVSEISDQMQQATDMAALMRIAAERLNSVLGGSHVFVRMGTELEFAGEQDHSF